MVVISYRDLFIQKLHSICYYATELKMIFFKHDTESTCTHTKASFTLVSVNHALKCILKVQKYYFLHLQQVPSIKHLSGLGQHLLILALSSSVPPSLSSLSLFHCILLDVFQWLMAGLQ